MYRVDFSPESIKDLEKLRKSEPSSFKKLNFLIEELKVHPKTGTGKPKPLSGNRSGEWSRRITDKHRLIYKIEEDTVIVLVLSAWGHYDDK